MGKVVSTLEISSELLTYGGIAVAGISVVLGIVLITVLWISKKRLNAKLDFEYGQNTINRRK